MHCKQWLGQKMSRRGSDSDVFIGFFCEHLRAMVASMPAARTVGKLGVVEQPYATYSNKT